MTIKHVCVCDGCKKELDLRDPMAKVTVKTCEYSEHNDIKICSDVEKKMEFCINCWNKMLTKGLEK